MFLFIFLKTNRKVNQKLQKNTYTRARTLVVMLLLIPCGTGWTPDDSKVLSVENKYRETTLVENKTFLYGS